ncbi:maleate cis-trans isomerase family protein [Modicisalibacter coralii]|uniref:maleate cis-trans isomerase family protein n=1 Tax=Modicisalibacter coralii TaxID=2304602 RepID=UPI00100AA818|nr:maleate cis-trans isomerase [Halomonas coralii]
MNAPLNPAQAKANATALFRPDGWNRTIRIGTVVPHADVGPEAELQAMATDDITIHGSRLYFSAMRAGGEMDEKIPHDPVASFAQPPYVDEAVESLAASPLDAVGLAFTSSAYKHGPDGERALIERLRPRARDLPLVSTCLSTERALAKLDAKRLAIVNPPWFDAELDELGARYFEAAGFRVVHHAPCGLPSGQKYITPESLYDWIAKIVAESEADTVFIGGNGQRSVGIIDAVEDTLGVSMITGNQVILWDALRSIDAKVRIEGYGKLFD